MNDEIKNVRLTDAIDRDRKSIIRSMMNNEAEFKDRTNRQKLSEISALIVADNEKAGFVNLIRANKNDNFLFLDMVIVEKFRKKGLGKKVFNIIQGYGFHNLIFAAAKVDNIAANKTAEEVCLKVATIEDENIYLVQKDRYEEFIEKDYMSKIVEYYSKEEKGVQLIKKQ